MKKFGKKVTNSSSLISDISDDNFFQNCNYEYVNDFHEKELSKKLKCSNVEKKENNLENKFLFKVKKSKNDEKTSEEKFSAKKISSNFLKSTDHDKEPHKKKCNLKRLSELEEKNLYNVLQIKETSDKETIKKSYKLLCKIHHPDKGGNADQFDSIHRAYSILSNDLCRKLYDNFSFQAMSLIEDILSLGDLEDNKLQELDLDILNSGSCDLEVIKILLQNKNFK